MDREKILKMDPYILLSWTNTKLRDEFDALGSLCSAYDLKDEDISNRLEYIGYTYNEKTNQFVPAEI